MPPYPMTPVVASRDYILLKGAHPVEIRAEIGTPTPHPDGIDWYCPFVLRGAINRVASADGTDALQALLLALSAVDALLQHHARDGTLSYCEGVPGTGISIV